MPPIFEQILVVGGVALITDAAAVPKALPAGPGGAALAHLRRHGVTDHPRYAAVERSATFDDAEEVDVWTPLGQPHGEAKEVSAWTPMGQLRYEEYKKDEEPLFLVSDEGVPCHLPMHTGGRKYAGCHPEGWCCIDPECAHRGTCNSTGSSPEAVPVVHPQDEPTTPCSLPTVGQTAFQWHPGSATSGQTTVFLLLDADGSVGWSEEELSPLFEVAQDPVQFVWISYSTNREVVERLMRRLQSRLREVLSSSSKVSSQRGPRPRLQAESAERKFFFVSTPAWHIPLPECWLPSVIHSWARSEGVLTVTARDGSVISRVATRGVMGNWAPSWGDGSTEAISGPLHWLGLACGSGQPAAPRSLGVALVQRGGCSFYRKAWNAQQAGASAVVVVNSGEEALRMGCARPDPCDGRLDIPAIMVPHSSGATVLRVMNETNRTLLARLAGERRGPSRVALSSGSIRAFGSVRHGLQSVAREVQGLEYEKRLLERRAEVEKERTSGTQAVELLPVFVRQRLAGSLVAPWTLADVKALHDGQYNSLELELQLECKDHQDQNCGPWDFEVNLKFCGLGQRKCTDPAGSIGRWITPYRREAHWLSNATAALPLLLGRAGVLHLHSNWWQAYTVTLTLWLGRNTGPAARGPVLLHQPLWGGGRFDEGYNDARKPRHFHVPPASSRAVLSVLLTGHGWGVEEANCAEFCNHTHHFAVNGQQWAVRAFPTAGTDDGCGRLVRQGVVPNQYGTWTFGRAGWCPGQAVGWWEVDVTPWLWSGGALNSITYKALFNGSQYSATPAEEPNTNGFPAEIHLASFLTFYGDVLASSEESKKPPVLLL